MVFLESDVRSPIESGLTSLPSLTLEVEQTDVLM